MRRLSYFHYNYIIALAFFFCCSSKERIFLSDDLLYTTTLVPSEHEWNKTFIEGYDPAKVMTLKVPVYFWMTCIDMQIRGYFFIENLRKPSIGVDLCRYGYFGENFRDRFRIFFDNDEVQYQYWEDGSGGEFFFNASQITNSAVLILSVRGWAIHGEFPLKQCSILEADRFPSTRFIMHTHIMDVPKGHHTERLYPLAVAKHLKYHRCAFNVQKYELIVSHELLNQFAANKLLAKFAENGWLTFVIKGKIPHHHRLHACYQHIYENTALLRYWKKNVRIFFFNADEFLTINRSHSAEVIGLLNSESNIAFDRFNSICADCTRKEDIHDLSFKKHRYIINSKEEQPKLLLDPDKNGCMACHWSQCGSGKISVSESKAFIVHFSNLFRMRAPRSNNGVFIHNDTHIDLVQCTGGVGSGEIHLNTEVGTRK
jgi:hypothetical protein